MVIDKLNEYLREHAITVRDLAESTGIREEALSGMLDGRRPTDLAQLALISDVLGVPVATFLEDDSQL